jgi:uncharacterized protein with von Willebrand factor type A (vWA) domain
MVARGDSRAGEDDWRCTDEEFKETFRWFWESKDFTEAERARLQDEEFGRLVHRPDIQARIATTCDRWRNLQDGYQLSATLARRVKEALPEFASSEEPLLRQVSRICAYMELAVRIREEEQRGQQQGVGGARLLRAVGPD